MICLVSTLYLYGKQNNKKHSIFKSLQAWMWLTSSGSSIWMPLKHVASASTAPSQPSYHWFCCSFYFRPQLSENLSFNLTSRWWKPCLWLLRLLWALFSFHDLYCVGVIEAKQKVWSTSRGQKFCLEAEEKTEEESRKQRTLFLAKAEGKLFYEESKLVGSYIYTHMIWVGDHRMTGKSQKASHSVNTNFKCN